VRSTVGRHACARRRVAFEFALLKLASDCGKRIRYRDIKLFMPAALRRIAVKPKALAQRD
jgi:hypothetical protein